MSDIPKSKIQNPKSTDLLIVITGPTASGKSALAIELAEAYGGEIICADSRTVYRGMDIGTANPSLEDRRHVPHYLLDVVDPDERFTAADFQKQARQVITLICARGQIPFVVGGTGLYIDGLIFDYKFGPDADNDRRRQWENSTVTELQSLLKSQHIPLPFNKQNKRHLVRSLEQGGVNNNRGNTIGKNIIVVAIATEKYELETLIRERVEGMFAMGIIAEAQALAHRFGWSHEALTGNIYPIIRRYCDGEITLSQAKELAIIKDRQLAKKQLTWLKRHNYIKWLTIDEARNYLIPILGPQN